MKHLYLTLDTTNFDLPSEFIASKKKKIVVRDVVVYPPVDKDFYILQSNFVENVISTDSDITSNFVCICNSSFLQQKRFHIRNNIRQISFTFKLLSNTPIDSNNFKFLIDLELEYGN